MLTKYFLTRFQPHIIGAAATLGVLTVTCLATSIVTEVSPLCYYEENVEKEEEEGNIELLTVNVQMVSPL